MDCDLRMAVAGARLMKEMKGEIFGFGGGRSSMDEGNGKYLARKNDIVFCFSKTLHFVMN